MGETLLRNTGAGAKLGANLPWGLLGQCSPSVQGGPRCGPHALSLSLFFLLLLFVFEKKIIELQHIVVFNLYKKQLLLFLGKTKKRLGT